MTCTIKNIFMSVTLCLTLVSILSYFFNLGLLSMLISITYPLIWLISLVAACIGLTLKKFHFAIGFIILFWCYGPFYKFPETNLQSNTNNKSFKILSFNTRSFNSEGQIKDMNVPKEIISFVNTIQPDILVLQEANYKACKQLDGYEYKFFGYRKDYNKSTSFIFSKHPIINTGYVDMPSTKNNSTYADIKLDNDTIRVYNIHLESYNLVLNQLKNNLNTIPKTIHLWHNTYQKQIAQANLVSNHVKTCSYNPIICGDFNATPFSLPYRILKTDLKDSFFEKGTNLGATYYLFKWYPLQLDHILTDENFEITEHRNFKLDLSDHEPVLSTFKTKT
ncbi:endonuclease/exonuclease/phosphatase family protein [Formosa sp. A9]|uniref:endonuclease/exonuclease/phosphatase family protein n=1 Tax=Formosa sp. A9 TaxID=3442641 RepID=UPI003EBC23A6